MHPTGSPLIWVLAPMIFDNCSHISINCHKNKVENVTNLVILWQRGKVKHPQFEIPNGGLVPNRYVVIAAARIERE